MLPLGIICQKCNVANHCYTDDIQLYLPLRCNNDSNISTLLECLDEISAWMASSFLQFNESKSKVVIFGPPKLAKQLSVHLGTLANNINTQVRNLGVTFDSELKRHSAYPAFNRQRIVTSGKMGSLVTQSLTLRVLRPLFQIASSRLVAYPSTAAAILRLDMQMQILCYIKFALLSVTEAL